MSNLVHVLSYSMSFQKHTHISSKNMCFWSSPNISQLSSSGGHNNKKKIRNEKFFFLGCFGEMSWVGSAICAMRSRRNEIANANNRITRKCCCCRRHCGLLQDKSRVRRERADNKLVPVLVVGCLVSCTIWRWLYYKMIPKPNFLRLFNISFVLSLVLAAFFSFVR